MARRRVHSDRYLRRKRLKRILSWFLFAVLIAGFVYAMNQPYFFLKEVRISGNQSISESSLLAEVQDHLSGSWMGIIPRKNLFFYGTSALSERLKTAYPKIYSTDIQTHVNELSIEIHERDSHSLWCVDKEYESVFDEECYFADQHGLWYMRAPYFSDNVFSKIYLDPRVKSIIQGEHFLEGTGFSDLFVFIDELKSDYGVDIRKIIFRRQGDVEIHLDALLDTPLRNTSIIHFNTKDSYERIHRNIGIVLDQKDFLDDFKTRPQALESVDVRFDGRIFYRFTPDQ